MQVKILCRPPAKDKSELSLVERWRDEDPSENLLSLVWDRPLNSLQDVALPGHRDGGSYTNKITASHIRELVFFFSFFLRIYQPDREAGYSFPIGVAGVTQTREEVEQVDLKN